MACSPGARTDGSPSAVILSSHGSRRPISFHECSRCARDQLPQPHFRLAWPLGFRPVPVQPRTSFLTVLIEYRERQRDHPVGCSVKNWDRPVGRHGDEDEPTLFHFGLQSESPSFQSAKQRFYEKIGREELVELRAKVRQPSTRSTVDSGRSSCPVSRVFPPRRVGEGGHRPPQLTAEKLTRPVGCAEQRSAPPTLRKRLSGPPLNAREAHPTRPRAAVDRLFSLPCEEGVKGVRHAGPIRP